MQLHTRFDPVGPVTFILTGDVDATCLPELDYVFAAARRLRKSIRLDLSEATMLDRASVQYLADQASDDVIVVYRQQRGREDRPV